MSTARVVVNSAIHLHGRSGSSTATHELVAALRHVDGVEVREVSPGSRGTHGSVRNAVADARWDLWQASRSLPDIDLLVSPCNIGMRGRAKKHLLVVHDVMAVEKPELFDTKFATYFRLLVPRSVRSADRVLTLSEHSAQAIRRMSPDVDVRVIAWPHPGGAVPRVAYPQQRTVLMVGKTEPVKNQVAGIEAVAGLRANTGDDVTLRVVGPAGRAEPAVREALAAADPRGAWTSREADLPSELLESAYADAWLLLQPSLDEGFGLPLVEAARYGLPVVHSGRGGMTGVLPKVDAAGVDATALAAAMTPLLDPATWQSVADCTATRAAAFEPAVFRSAVRDAVVDLLPRPS